MPTLQAAAAESIEEAAEDAVGWSIGRSEGKNYVTISSKDSIG
jgi:hypothetical protein